MTSSFPTSLISAQRKQTINPKDAEEQTHMENRFKLFSLESLWDSSGF